MGLLLALPKQTALTRHSLAALSQAIAACCHRAGAKPAKSLVDTFVKQLSGGLGPDSVFALLCLGETGRLLDLSSDAALLKTIMSGKAVRLARSAEMGAAAGSAEIACVTLVAPRSRVWIA